MDKMVLQQIDESDRISDVDFSALFVDLDCAQTAAPIDIGLQRLCRSLEELRRRGSSNHR